MHRNVLGDRVVGLVLDLFLAEHVVADEEHVGCLVVVDRVVEHLDVVHRQHHHARPLRHVRHDAPRVGEVAVVVVHDLVVEHADVLSCLDLQAREVEHEHTAGVVGGDVVMDVGVDRVFDFDARHVSLSPALPHHDPPRLPHVDAGVGGAERRALLDQDVRALHGVEAVAAVVGGGRAGPLHPDVTQRDVRRTKNLDGVASGVFDCQRFQREAVTGGLNALAAIDLPLEGEHRLVRPAAADRKPRRRDVDLPGQLVAARLELDDVAGE